MQGVARGTFATVTSSPDPIAAQLRAPDPATRLAGARALAQLVERTDVELVPALLASVDAAGMPFPTEPLTPALLARVETVSIDGTADIWDRIDPYWDGEGEINPATFDDVVHLPNLRTVEIDYYDDTETDVSAVHARGIALVVDGELRTGPELGDIQR